MSAKSRVANRPKSLREGKPRCRDCGHLSTMHSTHSTHCLVALCDCKKFVSKKKAKKET